MLYMKTPEGTTLLVLETEDFENIKRGGAKTPDGDVLLAWTPNADWLEKQIAKSDLKLASIAELIIESAKQPQTKPRPYFPTRTIYDKRRK